MGGSMMKKESLILLLSVYTCLLFAVPADMTPQYVVMANGDSILVVLHGAMSYAPTMTEVLRTKKVMEDFVASLNEQQINDYGIGKIIKFLTMNNELKTLKEQFDALLSWEKTQFLNEVFKNEENKACIDVELALEVLKKQDFDISEYGELLEKCDAETLLAYCDDDDLLDEIENRGLVNDLLERE